MHFSSEVIPAQAGIYATEEWIPDLIGNDNGTIEAAIC